MKFNRNKFCVFYVVEIFPTNHSLHQIKVYKKMLQSNNIIQQKYNCKIDVRANI